MRNLDSINEIIIHCAATPNGVGKFTIEDIDQWHWERGFHRTRDDGPVVGLAHVGYHRVIHIDGSTHQGRKWDEVGAHCVGHNAQSLGVCMIGTDKFTLDQWIALRQEVISMTVGLKRPLAIYGHRSFNPDKLCPGFDVQTWLMGGMAPLLEHIVE